ncbi:MAG: hypothetical protein WBG17_14340 [Burkholderiaceae bacterium]
MTRALRLMLLLCSTLVAGLAPSPAAASDISFGVIGHTQGATAGAATLRAAIAESDADNLGFVVASGIKSAAEGCGDDVYSERKILLDSAKNGLVVSLAASDWAGCRNGAGKSVAPERLARLRELFFNDDFSLGASRIPLIRQSASPKFRNYPENARWELGDILFATINLPADNNHYLSEAGRNSEFEDRQVASRHWLQRLFAHAAYKKLRGIVLFCDGNPLSPTTGAGRPRFDGYADMRQRLTAASRQFPGRVLVVHGPLRAGSPAPARIVWRGNLGSLALQPGWIKVTAHDGDPALFAVSGEFDAAAPVGAMRRELGRVAVK